MRSIDIRGAGSLRPSWAWLGILLAGLLILGLQSWVAWRARDNQVHATMAALRNLAGTLLRQAESTIEIADTAVLTLVERIETDGTWPTVLARVDQALAAQIAERPRYSTIIVTDAEGEVIAASAPQGGGGLGHRTYFEHHRASPDRGPFVGPPVISRGTQAWVITVSRRYNLPDGSFGGVVLASIDLSVFTREYATLDLGPGSSISMATTDGIGVARFPTSRQFEGQDVSSAAVFQALRQRPAGTFENEGMVDGVSRFNGYDSTGRYSLVVIASMSQEHALAAWRINARVHLAIAFILTATAALLGLLLQHHASRQLGMERRERLAAQEANAKLDQLTRHLAKARDAADTASRAKTRFLAGMSHELRTPLNGILGYAQLLRMEGGLDARQAARVEAMLSAGTHLLDLIHCVLELSEIESEHGEKRMAASVPRSIAEACLELVRPAAENKGLTLDLVIEPGLPAQILTDPTRLRQVLVNLLGNAVKFTSRGGVELRILKAGCGAKLRFEVADNGPGIPPSEVGRLFKEFERLEIDQTHGMEGAGLGLALSARLASLIGASIGYEDNPHGGSVFWLELPLELVPLDKPASPGQANADPVAVSGSRGLHVLVVDDILMNRDIASAFLQAAGHRVQCAESGAAAIAAVAAHDFDVVLMDVRMPEMDGLEATRRIRALGGARGRVAIVALTAQAFTEQVRECGEAGMDTHLSKPFSGEALIAIVEAAAQAGRAREMSSGPVPGSALRVLNPASFKVTASCLSPKEVDAHLRTIVGLCETLLRDLADHDAVEPHDARLVDAVHTLSGSAGLFGFERLAELGRDFERAVMCDAQEVPQLEVGLRAALGATVEDIRGKRLQAVEG